MRELCAVAVDSVHTHGCIWLEIEFIQTIFKRGMSGFHKQHGAVTSDGFLLLRPGQRKATKLFT
jgi:hypothetical protein